LEAALRRASSGVVDEIPADRPQLDEPSLELDTLVSEAPSTAIAPLVRDGRIIGLLAVHNTRGPREWTDAEVAAVGDRERR